MYPVVNANSGILDSGIGDSVVVDPGVKDSVWIDSGISI